MKKRSFFFKTIILVMLFISVIGCADPVLDGTNQQTLDASFEKILARKFGKEKQKTLIEFIRIENTYKGSIAFRYENETKQDREQRFFNAVTGMNAAQISVEAKRLEQASSLGNLLMARNEHQTYQEALVLLDKVEMQSVKFTPVYRGSEEHEFTAVLVNNTDYPIYSATFLADRYYDNVFKQNVSFYFKIPEGVLPSQEKTISSTERLSDTGLEKFVNFRPRTLWSTVDADDEYLIVGTNVREPSKENLDRLEQEYQSRYGDDEPADWSKNILREMPYKNLYRGKAYDGSQ